jgi:phospholipid/cholesterol/gamma-HCH transport system substrate-binding protein
MRTGSEFKVGLITILAIALALVFTFYIRGYRAVATYSISVTFDNARGLQRGDPVRMAGVKIGEVRSVEISPALKAETALSIERHYTLYHNYKFQIATSGIIQERFVEVIPQPLDPYSKRLRHGQSVEGVTPPDLSDLVASGNQVLHNLNRTSDRLRSVLADQEILAGVKQALGAFSTAAEAAAQLADSTSTLAQQSEPEILAVLQSLSASASDLETTMAALRARVREGSALDDFEATARETREVAANANRLVASLADVVSDPEAQRELRATITAIHDAAQSAKQAAEDLQVFSAEVRKAAPTVPHVVREAENIAETASTLRERLKPPEINAAFDVLHGPEADRTFSSARLDFKTSSQRFLRLGIDDIGEESDLNIQLGERQRIGVVRYGLVRSRLGFGLDFDLPRETTLSVDLFDPNDVRADLLADIPFILGRSDWGFLGGVRDIGDESLLVAGIRLRK